eukprot:scaffold37632_cov43-Prasinocladus_malaysianus.AAC.1
MECVTVDCLEVCQHGCITSHYVFRPLLYPAPQLHIGCYVGNSFAHHPTERLLREPVLLLPSPRSSAAATAAVLSASL